jgi:hypothetical protein
MCDICLAFKLDASDREDGINASHSLMDILGHAAKEHPFEYMLGPMSAQERRWYDLNSPDRKKNVETKTDNRF